MNRKQLIETFAVLHTDNGGIESFVSDVAAPEVLDRLAVIDSDPLSKVQLNQLLGLSKERAVSDGFFRYYWLATPKCPYKLSVIPGFSSNLSAHDKIQSCDHLFYGIYRIYVDGLLVRGNVRAYFRENASKSYDELDRAMHCRLIDTDAIKRRGPILPLKDISKDNRYLISEMACKSYGEAPKTHSQLKEALLAAWKQHEASGGGSISIRDLLTKHLKKTEHAPQQTVLQFAADDILDEQVASTGDIEQKYSRVADAFLEARSAALGNTRLYLSLVSDLDVYVATSMRTRKDFRTMADRCGEIFGSPQVADLHLRYFDPTMSAAEGHQDKGLIECLMVKCAKVLVYCAGEKESFGKDAEAAMALSLGKPVIFLCDENLRQGFYRDVHPLSRLINFETGVAVGAMVTSEPKAVAELLERIFENEMEYSIQQPAGKRGYLQLAESRTASVVRLQTNDSLLSEAFWNYYKSQA